MKLGRSGIGEFAEGSQMVVLGTLCTQLACVQKGLQEPGRDQGARRASSSVLGSLWSRQWSPWAASGLWTGETTAPFQEASPPKLLRAMTWTCTIPRWELVTQSAQTKSPLCLLVYNTFFFLHRIKGRRVRSERRDLRTTFLDSGVLPFIRKVGESQCSRLL